MPDDGRSDSKESQALERFRDRIVPRDLSQRRSDSKHHGPALHILRNQRSETPLQIDERGGTVELREGTAVDIGHAGAEEGDTFAAYIGKAHDLATSFDRHVLAGRAQP
ncbi:MAG: hypothetical protein AMXMBFR47_14340 [Planctomycetota bacterium]